jgi:hypothetical protein
MAVRAEIGVARPVEQARRVDGVARHIVRRPAQDQPGGTAGPRIGQAPDRPGIDQPVQHGRKARQQQARVRAQAALSRRQGGDHVGQPTGLDQRIAFRCDMKNPHIQSIL